VDADDYDAEAQPAAEDDNEADADNGEVAIVDALEISEADRDRDWGTASQIVAAFFAAYLASRDVALGVLGAAFQPVAANIMTSLRRINKRRFRHSAETLLDAADTADLPLPEFFAKATSDDERHELTTRVLVAAQDTARRDKRRALGRALAAGVMGDTARINEELLFVRAVDDINELHIRTLGHLTGGRRLTAADLAATDPGLANGAVALLNQLQSHGLIDSRAPVTPGGAMTPEPYYFITDSGRGFLDRLCDNHDSLSTGP
jgi:hypothetical protein